MVPTRLRSAAVTLLALAALGVGLAAAPAGARAAQGGDKGKGKSDKQLFQGKWLKAPATAGQFAPISRLGIDSARHF